MLGKKIKELRLENNITQEDLAKQVGVSTSMIGMYETGARKPSYEVLIKMANYFNVTTDHLLGKSKQRVSNEKLQEWDNEVDIKNLTKEAKALDDAVDNAKKLAHTLGTIPKEFTNPDEARAYIDKHQIFGSDGFNADNLNNDEILQFANELLRQMEMVSYKYRK